MVVATAPDSPSKATGHRPTMKDVAGVAGVSLATVSRVLSGTGDVRPDLADRVRVAVAKLGYRRDVMASTLRRTDRLSGSIGLVFENVSNPFLAAVHRGVEELARERGILAFVGSSDDDPERERSLTAAFVSRGVDGLVVVPSGDDQSYLARERELGVALVFVDRAPRFLDADVVLSDNVEGTRSAVEHLVHHGHRRIAFLCDRLRLETAQERLAGYRRALGEAGIAYDDALVRPDLRSVEDAGHAARTLLTCAEPPTALLTAQNLVTIGGVEALQGLGLQHRIALVGFDDVPLGNLLDPGVTVVAQDPVELGRRAARRLFERLDGTAGPSRRDVVATWLIRRGSGEIVP